MASEKSDLKGLDWGLAQMHVRSYQDSVVARIDSLPAGFTVEQYGELNYGPYNYPLYSVKVGEWSDSKPTILITGGVHGYEEAGTEAALHFLENVASDYADHYNILVYPCISPAAYEINSRWNMEKKDPNRNFRTGSDVQETAAFVRSIEALNKRFLMSIDLHETLPEDKEIMAEQVKDTGVAHAAPDEADEIPEEFYLYEDCPEQKDRLGPAIIEAVEKITPVYKGDKLFGDAVTGGVLYPEGGNPATSFYPKSPSDPTAMDFFMEASGYTPQSFTTETYTGHITLQERIAIQIAVIRAALDKAMSRPAPAPAAMHP